jgi:hypothetical protein
MPDRSLKNINRNSRRITKMKRRSLSSLLIFAIAATILSACGGGSSSTAVPLPTTATVSISTSGTLDTGVKIGGITVSAILPPGVTVKATPDLSNSSVLVTNPGVVVVSGVTGTNASAPFNTYDATDRKLTIYVIDPDGFEIGKFVSVHCNIAAGTTPKAGAFDLVEFIPGDLQGNPISGLTPEITVNIR